MKEMNLKKEVIVITGESRMTLELIRKNLVVKQILLKPFKIEVLIDIFKNIFEDILKDEKRLNSLIYTKSKSTIGWENERPIKHFELLKKLREHSYALTVPYIEEIKKNINVENIDKILNEFGNNIISENMKNLIKIYLLDRRKRMLDIYNLEG